MKTFWIQREQERKKEDNNESFIETEILDNTESYTVEKQKDKTKATLMISISYSHRNTQAKHMRFTITGTQKRREKKKKISDFIV